MNRSLFSVLSVCRLLSVTCLLTLCAACSGPQSAGQTGESERSATSGPAAPVAQRYAIVYAPPASGIPAGVVQTVAAGYASGEIPYALHLENTQPESAKAGFSAAFILGFRDETTLASWQRKITPLLVPPVEMLLAERLFHEENPGRDSSVAVFQGNFMQPKVDRTQFADFSQRYMHKYLELQRQAGILTSYAMYQAGGAQGLAFMMREHTNPSIFDNRNPPKDRLRDELMARDADYRQLEDTAIEYRIHLNSTTARSVPIGR